MLPAAAAADADLLQLGMQLLHQLDALLPRGGGAAAAAEEQQDSLATTTASSSSSSSSSSMLGMRLAEASLYTSLLAALATHQAALLPLISCFFMQHISAAAAAASPPPPWFVFAFCCLPIHHKPQHGSLPLIINRYACTLLRRHLKWRHFNTTDSKLLNASSIRRPQAEV